MGGSPQQAPSSQTSTASASLGINPTYGNAINNSLNGLTSATNNFANAATKAAGAYNNNFSQFNPTLNTNFGTFTPSATLDTIGQGQVAQQTAQNQAATAGQNANITNNFRANPGASQVLQAQNNIQGQLANNSNVFNAAQNQQAREAQTFGINQQAQSLSNAALAQQAGINANNQALSNSGLAQQLSLLNSGVGSQQNLMAILGSLAQLTGTQNNTSTGQIMPMFANGQGGYTTTTPVAQPQPVTWGPWTPGSV